MYRAYYLVICNFDVVWYDFDCQVNRRTRSIRYTKMVHEAPGQFDITPQGHKIVEGTHLVEVYR